LLFQFMAATGRVFHHSAAGPAHPASGQVGDGPSGGLAAIAGAGVCRVEPAIWLFVHILAFGRPDVRGVLGNLVS
jgi:hypothetical protein